jgi:hypothetical protein
MKVKTVLAIIVFILLVLGSIGFIHPYGFTASNSLNRGIAIGASESCQFGYEVAGTPGLFGYCDLLPHVELFEDSSFIIWEGDNRVFDGCLPFSICNM